MMSWRALSPKTIVAAAEAIARRNADDRTPMPLATASAKPAVAAAAAPLPVNDAGAPPTAAE